MIFSVKMRLKVQRSKSQWEKVGMCGEVTVKQN